MSQTNPKNELFENLSTESDSQTQATVSTHHPNFWQRLIEPSETIIDTGTRRQASLVSALLLALVVALSTGVIANSVALHQYGIAAVLGCTAIALGTTYGLSRTRHYKLAQALMFVFLVAVSILDVLTQKDISANGLVTVLIFNVLVILIGSALVSIRTTIYLSIGNLLWILLLPLIIPGISYGNLVIPALFNGILSVLILVLTQNRNLTERDRLSEMANINVTLQASNDALNVRTRDLDARTRELDLAAEVGRAISQVRSLELTLKEAAEIIRSRFDLYYVQVYLTDPSRTSLVFQSGTGTVGAELIARGHQLPLNTASINGRAAIEKHTVVISDTSTSTTFRPNPLLPDTRSEMAVPLMIGENVLGVLDLQSQKTGILNDEMLSAFEALAGQFAIAIQNARLLQEIQQSRAEVESQARRLTRTGWQEYLDALHKPERLGFVYEQNRVAPFEEIPESVHEANALAVPIAITGEQIGTLAVSVEEGKQTANNVELVNIVARQVAQQIENLRLLDSAERYRREAEEAARHLTREGWQNYAESKSSEELGFLYDLKEVKPYAQPAEILAEQPNMILPLKVRDETVGKLAILGVDETDTEANELANAVAERLSAHIEGLRLSKQTEQALATTQEFAQREQSLRQITSAVRGSTDPVTILRTAVRELGTLLGRKIVVRMENTREAQASQTDSSANNGEKTNSPAGLLNAVGGDE